MGIMERKMGDRFYNQQKNYKPKRKLKKEYVEEVDKLLGEEIKGLERLTIKSLEQLYESILHKLVT